MLEEKITKNGLESFLNDEQNIDEVQEYIEDNEIEDSEELLENFLNFTEEKISDEKKEELLDLIDEQDFEFDDIIDVDVVQKNFVASVYFYGGSVQMKRSDLKAIQNGEKSVSDFLTGDEDWDLIREKITADDYEYDLD
jgi:hypothetical protein